MCISKVDVFMCKTFFITKDMLYPYCKYDTQYHGEINYRIKFHIIYCLPLNQ